MKRFIIIHYGEIWLKKANTEYFVKKLCKFIKEKLEGKFKKTFFVKHVLGRILVNLVDDFSEEDEKKYSAVIKKIFGIKNFKFVYAGSIDFKVLVDQIWANFPKKFLNEETRPKSFCVRVKRSMLLPCKSFEAEGEIGSILIEKGFNVKVRLNNPEFVVDIEFFDGIGYFSYEKYMGQGGMPVNSQNKLVALISAGIDSPVAAYRMMRRGARIIFVHFHSYPYTDKDETDHVKELVEILSDYQFDTKLYLVPFGKIQKTIATSLDVPAKARTVLYRRMMLKIAELVVKKEKAKGLVTGDSFGQVASQTSENMLAIHDISSFPLYQPLIAYDKEEIIKISEEIGTFEISKLPCKDSCSMFMPKHPELKANIYDVRGYEEKLFIDDLIKDALKECEILNY